MNGLKYAFTWLGVEANARAITGLLAIGGALGAFAFFSVDKVAPKVSPIWSSESYGEGYRRGRREMELEQALQKSEATITALRTREQIDQQIRSMSSDELDAALKRWERR